MAKDKSERIRDLLNPREALLFEGKMHPAIYSLPILIFLLGAGIMFLTIPEVTQQLPERWMAVADRWIYGAKETFLGLWMMGGGIIFAFKFHMEDKHLIQLVTNQRVVQVSGAFVTHLQEMGLQHVGKVRIKRGHILNRLLHRGDIFLDHHKDKTLNIVMRGVSHPDAFVEHLRIAQDRYAESLAIRERAEKERSKN